MLGSSLFFKRKNKWVKAWIFGSLSNDYHQVSKNWFSHISVVLKKIIERANQGTSPEAPSYFLGLSKSPLELGVRTKKNFNPTWENPKKVGTYMNNE